MMRLLFKFSSRSAFKIRRGKECIPGDFCPRLETFESAFNQKLLDQANAYDIKLKEQTAKFDAELKKQSVRRCAREVVNSLQAANSKFAIEDTDPDPVRSSYFMQMRQTRNESAHLVLYHDGEDIEEYKWSSLARVLATVKGNREILSQLAALGVNGGAEMIAKVSETLEKEGFPPGISAPDQESSSRVNEFFSDTLTVLGTDSVDKL